MHCQGSVTVLLSGTTLTIWINSWIYQLFWKTLFSGFISQEIVAKLCVEPPTQFFILYHVQKILFKSSPKQVLELDNGCLSLSTALHEHNHCHWNWDISLLRHLWVWLISVVRTRLKRDLLKGAAWLTGSRFFTLSLSWFPVCFHYAEAMGSQCIKGFEMLRFLFWFKLRTIHHC